MGLRERIKLDGVNLGRRLGVEKVLLFLAPNGKMMEAKRREEAVVEALREARKANYAVCQKAISQEFVKDFAGDYEGLSSKAIQEKVWENHQALEALIVGSFQPLAIQAQEFLHSLVSQEVKKELAEIERQSAELQNLNYLTHGLTDIYVDLNTKNSYCSRVNPRLIEPDALFDLAQFCAAGVGEEPRLYEKLSEVSEALGWTVAENFKAKLQSLQKAKERLDVSEFVQMGFIREKEACMQTIKAAVGEIQTVLDDLPDLDFDGPRRGILRNRILSQYRQTLDAAERNLRKSIEQVAQNRKEARGDNLVEVGKALAQMEKACYEFQVYRNLAERAIEEYFCSSSQYVPVKKLQPLTNEEYALLRQLDQRYRETESGLEKIGKQLNLKTTKHVPNVVQVRSRAD